jgi:RNA polymerase sigma-70 factor (ECF subfamily)
VELDAIYRAHAPAIVASLAKAFGPARLDLIEGAVQEAFVAALEQWREAPPEKPAAWLHAVARRRVIDALRRAAWLAPGDELDRIEAGASDAFDDGDLLAMMFACCHPAIPVESALALALRTLCGFPIAALCRALRADEAALEKRLARARAVLRAERVAFELGDDVDARLDSVLRTLYVLFLEGYSVHAGAHQIDADLCASAIRLADLLLVSRFARPHVQALQALFLLQASRLAARVDERGELVPLHAQDRARWDRAMIARGLEQLSAASTGDAVSAYHLEAAIAACHALAPSYDATDWRRIVALYDRLLALQPSPIVALQRAIAIGRAEGPRAGLQALEQIDGDARLDDDPVLAAAKGELAHQLGDTRTARAAYARALELAGTEPERRFLEAKLAALSSSGSP